MSTTYTTRRNRQTGTMISVASASACCADETDVDARWFTICEEHGDNIAHATRKQANWFAASPLDWCGGCQIAAGITE